MSLLPAVTEETRVISPYRKFEGHTAGVRGAIHLPDGQQIMTCSYDGSLRVWNLRTGKQNANDWGDGESPIHCIGLSPDGKKVVIGSEDGAVRLWDVDTGKFIAKWEGHKRMVVSVCWSRDGGQVVTGAYGDGTARVWDVENGKTMLAIETGLNYIVAVIYSPDTTMIATGGYHEEEYLKIWDAKTGILVANLNGHTKEVICLAWTVDGKTLLSGSSDYSIRTWNTSTWQQIMVLTGHTNYVWDIAISPNGRILASASKDDTARLWDLENGQPISLPLQHEDTVRCTSFSTDGKLLATCCYDNNAYMWDIYAIAKEVGFSDLLSPNDKSLLHAGATRPRGDWRRNPYPGPSNDTLHHPPLPGEQILSPFSAYKRRVPEHISSHLRATPDHTSSPSQRNDYNTGNMLIQWARNPFFNMRNRGNNEGIELHERRAAVVDVPLTRGKPRIYSRREVEMKQEKEEEKRAAMKEKQKQKARDTKVTKNMKNTPAGSSQPSQSNGTQQPKEAQTPPIPEPHSIGVPTSPITSVITANPAGIAHWTRFWSSACCSSTQNADGNH